MKKVIWKYKLELDSETWLTMPINSDVLTLQIDKKDNAPYLWVLVNPNEEEKEQRLFELFGTGHEIVYDMGVDRYYIGTFQYQKGQFIRHVFERETF